MKNFLQITLYYAGMTLIILSAKIERNTSLINDFKRNRKEALVAYRARNK